MKRIISKSGLPQTRAVLDIWGPPGDDKTVIRLCLEQGEENNDIFLG